MQPCWWSPKYLHHQLVYRNNTQQPNKSPGFWSSEGTSLSAALPHKCSAPRFKFVLREKVIFTLGCVQDLFKALVQGSLSMPFLRLSAAAESKGSAVDAVVAGWSVLKLDIFVTVCQQGKTNKNRWCFYVKSRDYLKERRPLIHHIYSE